MACLRDGFSPDLLTIGDLIVTPYTEIEISTTKMTKRKKPEERPSQALEYNSAKSTRSSTATSERQEITRPASSQAVRPSRKVKKQHMSPSLSGDECSDASDEYIPSTCTSPSIAADDESEAPADTSEGDDGNTEQDVAVTKEDSESDDEPRAAKRRKVSPHNATNPSSARTGNPKVSTNSVTGKAGKTNAIGDLKSKRGIDANLPPLHDIREIFEDMTQKALNMSPFTCFLKHLRGRELKVATMCSGTESPLLALRLVANSEYAS